MGYETTVYGSRGDLELKSERPILSRTVINTSVDCEQSVRMSRMASACHAKYRACIRG